ncbi:MAG: carbohydrate binding domain-containing protein [Saprospiraceae bacterium]|nr:carbohydrate binding domain-containing protein [Saprospiraceae bacterium]
MKNKSIPFLLTVLFCSHPLLKATTNPDSLVLPVKASQFTVNTDQIVSAVQPTMYGIFFEDINFGADGGLYAELVKNRSFEFDAPMMGWEQPESDRFSMNDKSGFAVPVKYAEAGVNKNYLNVKVNADKGYRLVNEGFKGMGFKQGLRYDFSVFAKQTSGGTTLHVELLDENNKVLATSSIPISGGNWKEYTASLTPSAKAMKGKLSIRFEGKGVVDLDVISLFPNDTWKGRPKGLRADLVQLLADLKPGFLRFPGGCIVEGRTLALRYQWKKTVGKVNDRELLINRWNNECAHRPAPDYFQTFGLGFFEYFQMAEDIGASPLPILSCGMACQFNTAELVPMDEIDPYVHDALDLIEFANGPVTSTWGKLRSDMGHPAPFNLKMIGVGNEQWGPEYIERYKVFEKAIHGKYPEIKIVSGAGPFPEGEMFEYGWEELKELKAEIVDEHYYRSPQWFLENANRYDSYDRKGPKIFAGEYAAQSVAIASPDNRNNWDCALAEAAFMTGLERNADVVYLTSYAPLLAHSEGWQWTPDLIWFNNLEAYGTPNYYVQKLFANHVGNQLLKITEEGKPVIGQSGLYATATIDEKAKELVFKIVNASAFEQSFSISMTGKKAAGTKGKLITLANNDKNAVNSFESPKGIYPTEKEVNFTGKEMSLTVVPKSVNVLRVAYK